MKLNLIVFLLLFASPSFARKKGLPKGNCGRPFTNKSKKSDTSNNKRDALTRILGHKKKVEEKRRKLRSSNKKKAQDMEKKRALFFKQKKKRNKRNNKEKIKK